MTGPQSTQPVFYRPSEVAVMLRCSEWWVKEQARQRRIPYAWIGGSYLFTPEHVAEIIRRFEVQPTDTEAPAPARRITRPTTTDHGDGGDQVVRLTARVPRRARVAPPGAAA